MPSLAWFMVSLPPNYSTLRSKQSRKEITRASARDVPQGDLLVLS